MPTEYRHEDYPWHSPEYLKFISTRSKPPLLLVGVLRISQETEDSTSIERQKIEETQMAEERFALIVGWAEDRDVSATRVPAFKRPQLRHWLEKRKNEFNGFIAWKLDRLTRNSKDTRRLVVYMEDNNKVLWSVAEPFFKFDPNATGIEKTISDLLLSVLTMIAEMESANIATRQKSSKKRLREVAKWPGGPAPYWTRTTKSDKNKNPRSSETLDIVPERAKTVLKMIDMLLAGKKLNEIARWLNSEGIPTSRVAQAADKGRKVKTSGIWGARQVSLVLRNRMLIGEFVEEGTEEYVGPSGTRLWRRVPNAGKVVVDRATGLPEKFCERLIERATFDRVQALLDKNARFKTRPGSTGIALAGIAKCARCAGTLGRRELRVTLKSGETREHAYYYCNRGRSALKGDPNARCSVATGMRADVLEPRFDDYLASNLSQRRIVEEVYVQGSGSSDEIARLEGAIVNMTAEYAKDYLRDDKFLSGVFEAQIKDLRAQLEELNRLGVTQSRWEMRDTGRTFLDEWMRSDWARRRELIQESEIVIKVDLERDIYIIEDPLEIAMISGNETEGA